MTVSYEQFYHQSFPPQEKSSYLAWLLKNRPVLPTSTGLKQVGLEPVYRDTPALRQLVGDAAAYLVFQPKDAHQPFIGGVLEVIWEPEQAPVEAVKAHLRQLKQNNTAVAEQGAAIYTFLVERGEIDFLEAEELIFLPATARGWWPHCS
jgi:hypothetical protein